jgi:hypothetical protein
VAGLNILIDDRTLSVGWADYELIDSGSYEKLERYGRYIFDDPSRKLFG